MQVRRNLFEGQIVVLVTMSATNLVQVLPCRFSRRERSRLMATRQDRRYSEAENDVTSNKYTNTRTSTVDVPVELPGVCHSMPAEAPSPLPLATRQKELPQNYGPRKRCRVVCSECPRALSMFVIPEVAKHFSAASLRFSIQTNIVLLSLGSDAILHERIKIFIDLSLAHAHHPNIGPATQRAGKQSQAQSSNAAANLPTPRSGGQLAALVSNHALLNFPRFIGTHRDENFASSKPKTRAQSSLPLCIR